MSRYSQKLKHPKWQKKRLKIMERDGWECVACESECDTLNVHHIEYHGDPWDADSGNLQTLCEKCHKALGPHPKGGAYYKWIHTQYPEEIGGGDEHYLAMIYKRCPKCGCEETDNHSGCIIFACDCARGGLPMPARFADRFFSQDYTDGYSSYMFWKP